MESIAHHPRRLRVSARIIGVPRCVESARPAAAMTTRQALAAAASQSRWAEVDRLMAHLITTIPTHLLVQTWSRGNVATNATGVDAIGRADPLSAGAGGLCPPTPRDTYAPTLP
jgi:hypothetical protein